MRFKSPLIWLFVLFGVVAVVCAYLNASLKDVRRETDAINRYARMGAHIRGVNIDGWLIKLTGRKPHFSATELCMGDPKCFNEIGTGAFVAMMENRIVKPSDSDLIHLSALRSLKELKITSDKVTDSGLAPIANLKELEVLELTLPRMTDSGLQCLQALPHLRVLRLTGTRVSEVGTAKLKGMNARLQIQEVAAISQGSHSVRTKSA